MTEHGAQWRAILRDATRVENILAEKFFRFEGRSNGVSRYVRDANNYAVLFDNGGFELTLDNETQRFNEYRPFAKALRKKYPRIVNRA